MKRILCLLCILTLSLTIIGCTQTYAVLYDDIMLYVTPTTNASPGETVNVVVNAQEGASFIVTVNDVELSPHDCNESFITYEFIMPSHAVTIRHIIKEDMKMQDITIPATMSRHRISYATEFAFEGKYTVVTNSDEATQLFAGFSLAYPDEVKPYPTNFFDNNILIACLQHEGSGSIVHTLKSVRMNDNVLTITINREVPYIGTCDMASWLCLIAVSKNALPPVFDVEITMEKQEV